MDSIGLTFSSRRIQALINNTYLASSMSFSFFSVLSFLFLCYNLSIMQPYELLLVWEVFWFWQLGCWLLACFLFAEGLHRTLQRALQLICLLPSQGICTHTLLVTCAFLSEAAASNWKLPYSLQCCGCGATGGEKNLSKRGKVLQTTTTSCILPLLFLQFDFVFLIGFLKQ